VLRQLVVAILVGPVAPDEVLEEEGARKSRILQEAVGRDDLEQRE